MQTIEDEIAVKEAFLDWLFDVGIECSHCHGSVDVEFGSVSLLAEKDKTFKGEALVFNELLQPKSVFFQVFHPDGGDGEHDMNL